MTHPRVAISAEPTLCAAPQYIRVPNEQADTRREYHGPCLIHVRAAARARSMPWAPPVIALARGRMGATRSCTRHTRGNAPARAAANIPPTFASWWRRTRNVASRAKPRATPVRRVVCTCRSAAHSPAALTPLSRNPRRSARDAILRPQPPSGRPPPPATAAPPTANAAAPPQQTARRWPAPLARV